MKEWTVFDEVFPFICENSDCKKEYNNKEFTSAALKWGYIFLTNNKYNFIGLTCPSCKTTTIHKYSLKTSDLINKMNFQFRCFVPFFVDDLPDLNQEHTEDLYHVPDNIQKPDPEHPYPQWFEEGSICNIYEKDFNKIIAYENKNHKKVFPRIITTFSIYNKTDGFLSLLKSGNAPIDDLDDIASNLNELIMNIAKNNYLAGPESNITEDEYKDLNILYAMAHDYGEDFVKTIPAFLDEYIQMRNNFDFEISYKTDFLDKYIKQFYYSKGYYGSKQFYNDKAEYEEIFGKQFKGGIKAIDDSGDQEILSHEEVLQRWDKNINILKKFVMSRDLPAYYTFGGWFDPLSPQAQNLDIDPKDYIYLKSEVEELEIRKPWLSKNTIDPLDPDRKPVETTIEILEGQKCVSYKKLFKPYLAGATSVKLVDPYIHSHYQIQNFMSFCKIITPSQGNLQLEIVTSAGSKNEKIELASKFDKLKTSFKKNNIIFSYNFGKSMHDRWIESDTGWKIFLSRGLDFIQKPEAKFILDFADQTKRACKATTITYVRK